MSKSIYTQEQFDKILEERNELANENFKLKQHLTEKEKEIERWKEQYFTEIGALSYAFNQAFVLDKISFAVEQLEKVKEKVICGVMDISNNYWSCFVKDGSQYMTSEDLYDALEQEFIHQIEELKKDMGNNG